jgi:hypothetical protein
MSFVFYENVPVELHTRLRPWLEDWIKREDYPVYGLYIPNIGTIDFCRRPWPPSKSVTTTVGAERDNDVWKLNEWVGKP